MEAHSHAVEQQAVHETNCPTVCFMAAACAQEPVTDLSTSSYRMGFERPELEQSSQNMSQMRLYCACTTALAHGMISEGMQAPQGIMFVLSICSCLQVLDKRWTSY